MNQLVITHADGSSSAYPVTDSTVATIDGVSVSLAGASAVSLEEAPVAVAAPAEPQTDAPAPALAAVPEPAAAPEAATQPAAPTDPPQPASAPDAPQP